ncbi:MAG: M48 family metalloprotease [Magnetococcales bacterium]|nr:M48 family metalloprotease [Magnetococcales bacterium]
MPIPTCSPHLPLFTITPPPPPPQAADGSPRREKQSTPSVGILFLFALSLLVFGVHAPLNAADKKKKILMVTDHEVLDFLDDLGDPLVKASGLPEDTVRFHVIVDGSLNAFALPNQHIVFHSGLLLAAHDRDEIAGVLAHEVAHLAAGHHVQIKSEATAIQIQSMIAMAAGMAAGLVTGEGDIAKAAIIGSQAGATSAMLDTIRKKEAQSDRLSVGYMAQVGYNPKGIVDFLGRIQRKNRMSNLPPGYLRTHPISDKRMEEALDLVEQTPMHVPMLPADQDNRSLRRIQAKLLAGLETEPLKGVRLFRSRLRKHPDPLGPSADPIRYGLAVSLRYSGHLSDAESVLNTMVEEDHDDPYLLLERGPIRLEYGHLVKAEQDFRAALTIKPHHPGMEYALSKVLIASDRHGEASRILRRLTAKHPEKQSYFYLLGKSEGLQGHKGPSHLALARHYALMQDRENALWHYQEAEKHFATGTQEYTLSRSERLRLMEKEE